MEHLIRRFEQAHQQGDRPEIDGYLQSSEADEPTLLLIELIHTELELRIKSGENVSVDEYFERYPALRQNLPVMLSLIRTEVRFRRRCGAAADVATYYDRFPELADQLRKRCTSSPSPAAGGTALPDPATALLHSWPDNDPLEGCGEVVAGSPLFESLPRAAQRLLDAQLVERQFARGEHLLRQGAKGSSLLIVRQGNAEIIARDDSGRPFLIEVAGPQDVLGEMALLTDEPCSADVVATTPVEALVLPAEAFHALAAEYPVFVRVLTHIVASRLGVDTRDVLAGKQLGGYRIRQRAGRGGMSIVYDADDVQTGRRVALKMMSHRLVYNPEALRLFRREAALIEAFDHPHIIRMFGRFEAFHTYFIVLEFAEGRTLADLLDSEGPPDADQTRRILGQLAQAIAYAHSRQVLHRDIKPGNIMLGPDGNAKLMDFGLATPLGEPASASRLIVGTPGYMAPEQAEGGPLTAATDFFGLGCVAYEMIAGEPLRHRTNRRPREEPGLEWSPSTGREISFRELCPQADPALTAALENCLHPDPHRRTLDLETLSRYAPSSALV